MAGIVRPVHMIDLATFDVIFQELPAALRRSSYCYNLLSHRRGYINRLIPGFLYYLVAFDGLQAAAVMKILTKEEEQAHYKFVPPSCSVFSYRASWRAIADDTQ